MWIIIAAAVVFICCGVFLLLKYTGSGNIAVISVDGVEYERIDLSHVSKAYDIQIDTQYGHNTVHVEPGAISVSDSDCPDRICMAQGTIRGGGVPIICAPHRLVITIEGGDVDA